MPSNKRRKIHGNLEPKALSAFAARKQLQQPHQVAGTPHVPSRLKKEDQNNPNRETFFDGRHLETSSVASLLLRNGLEERPNNGDGNDNGVGQDDEMSDSPDQDEESIDILTERKSRAGMPADIPARPIVKLTNLKPSKANVSRSKNKSLLIKLSAGERLVLLGEYGLSVIKGQITILGAILSPSDTIYSVYAFASHSLPVIRFLSSEDGKVEIRIYQQSTGLRDLKQLSPLFGRLCHDSSNAPPSGSYGNSLIDISNSSFKLLFSTEETPRGMVVNPIISPPEWNEVISVSVSGKTQHGKASSTMICGPKSSGKSTFARLLTNRLLSFATSAISNGTSGTKTPKPGGVAFLDLDPGQPEYSTPGHLSLVYLSRLNLGPPYSHSFPVKESHEIIRAHSIAALSPAVDPVLYMKCVRELLGHYRTVLSTDTKCSLIINTPGWVLGTGLEILVDIVKASHPTEIIYMSQEGPASVVSALRGASKTIPVLTIPSQTTEYTARTAAHLRSMQLMSYFHTESKEQRGLSWNAESLSSMPPWEVKFSGTTPGILGVICMGEQPPPNMLKDSIDGTLLSVVVLDDIAAVRRTEDQHEGDNQIPMLINTPEGIPYFNPEVATYLDPNYCHTIGLALVRGIDTKQQRLQLLTPISSYDIKKVKDEEKVIVLISGKIDTPGWAYTEELYKKSVTEKRRRKEKILKGTSDDGEDSEDYVDDNMEEISEEGFGNVPWTEKLQGDQGRGVGARVWRVRRDLGKSGGDGGG